MVAAARKHNRMVQMGTQARSAPYLHEAVEYVAGGQPRQGDLRPRPGRPTARAPSARSPDSDPPAGVDYDLWLGPAPKRPFNRRRFHGNWRWFFDYGTGDLGNDGVHRIDYCRCVMGLDRAAARRSPAAGGKFFFDDAQEWPDTHAGHLRVPRPDPRPTRCASGRSRGCSTCTEGAAVYGENGWMLLSNTRLEGLRRHGQGGQGRRRGRSPLHAARPQLPRRRARAASASRCNQEIAQGHVSSVHVPRRQHRLADRQEAEVRRRRPRRSTTPRRTSTSAASTARASSCRRCSKNS